MKQGDARDAVCESCGAVFTAYGNRTELCPECRKAVYRARWKAKKKEHAAAMREQKRKQEAEQKQENTRKNVEQSWQSVAEIQEKAEKAGLSYGQYVARMDGN